MSELKYLTAGEAAQRLRLHVDSLYRLLSDGRLAGARRGERGRWLITEADVQAYLSRPKGAAPPPPGEAERVKRAAGAAERLAAKGMKIQP